MKSFKEKCINSLVYGLQIILSFIMLFIFYDIQLLPQTYLMILSGVLFTLCIGEYFLIFYQKPKSKRSLITQVLSVLLSIVMGVASVYGYKMGEVVNLLGDDAFQKRAISVIVLKDSVIRNEKQLPKHQVGYISSLDQETMNYTLNQLRNDIDDIAFEDYKDFHSLLDALYQKKSDAIILDEAFRPLLEQDKPTLNQDTRVIYQVMKDESVVKAKGVDVTQKPFLVYVSGNDEYGEMSAISRSDVNMLAAINPQTKQVLLISIPRDTYFPLHRNGQLDKLTHAGIYGLQESIDTLEDMIQEDVNYYVRMNFTSFINIVDAIGGITINSPMAFTTKIGKYSIQKGINHLNAKQALAFVRERKSFVGGDFERGKNQQRMIAAIIDKICSPTILTSFSSVLDTISQSIETNLSSDEIQGLVQLQLSTMPTWDIQTYQIIGDTGMKPCYSSSGQLASVVIPYQSSITQAQSYIDELFSGKTIQTQSGNLDQKGNQEP